MIKDKKKVKKKIYLNGIPKKIDYDAYIVIRNQEEQLNNHESALIKYALIYSTKDKHTEDEELLYNYCMQFPSITGALDNIKKNNEEETKNK